MMLLAAIALGSLAPVSFSLPGPTIQHFDKVLHFCAYALLTAWYLVVFPGRYTFIAIPVLMLAIGISIEWLQGLTGYRDASVADALANMGGILVASWLIAPLLQRMLLHIEQLSGAAPGNIPNKPPSPQLRHRALWQILGMHIALAVLISAFMPIEVERIPVTHIDKLLHFSVYGALTAWFLLVFPHRKIRILTPVVMIILSISVELMQGLTSFGGEPSLYDAMADTLGILFACLLVISPLKQTLLQLERLFFRPRLRVKSQSRRPLKQRPGMY